MKMLEYNSNVIIIKNVMKADTFSKRIKGLLGRNSLSEDEGMYFENCRMIHTFFMKFAIDVVFFDDQLMAVEVARNLSPYRMTFCKAISGRHTLELASGVVEKHKIIEGKKYVFS